MILAIILSCEIGFWVLILLGLIARYVFRRPKLGAALLIMTPVVDLILLAAVAIDLSAGGTAHFAHTLAAIYLGFSIAYGHRMIAWADVRFAHRFSGGPAPVKRFGAAYTRACWADVLRTGLAIVIASAVLGLLIGITGDAERSRALTVTFRFLGIIFTIEVIWAASYTVWPKKAPVTEARTHDGDVTPAGAMR